MLDCMFIKIETTEIDHPDCPSKEITQKVFQNLLKRQGWTFKTEKKNSDQSLGSQKTQVRYNLTIFYLSQNNSKLDQTRRHHSTTITQSNLYEVNSSRHYKCKGLFTEEFQSILELQNHQSPKVKTGLVNHNNWRYLSDSRQSTTTFSTQ